MTTMRELLALSPVLPVVTIDDPALAIDVAKALAEGGIGIAEITLRTPAGLPAIERIATHVPGFVVAAGTVLTRTDLAAAARAGATFAVSPGATRELLEAAAGGALPFLPAVATASELMQAAAFDHEHFKFFPAAAAGGIAALDALAGPFPDARFCPTGGITEDTAAAYLARPNVVCVGGSWIAPRAAIARRDWAAITRAAQRATQRGSPPR
ncbi:MAG TPA: bifunctional 4-hydroxy-2-oxoglutarate aldolase/2-dehydro-3-deoxy-phosphogluconate aldolase [Gammaproteobacteria bacterium]|nr:bifunctional 4-hydroxy-2-oxoglutarate aldolase/2-dehydro-3-deoxy-phosphogluconate aldolase [Gammaproteobacteria bacterium]